MTFFSRFFNQKKEEDQKPQNWKQSLFCDFKDILYILVIFLVIYALFFRMVIVVGDSMNQTLVDGDRIMLISGTLYRNPKQGDIVVVSKDSFRGGECIVKRVIATEGQKVDIDFENRIVYVDDIPLEESYVYFAPNDHASMSQQGMKFPLVVSEGCIFVMGDNRNDSLDSRDPSIGLVDHREILGKAIFILFPGTDDGRVEADYSRIGGLN